MQFLNDKVFCSNGNMEEGKQTEETRGRVARTEEISGTVEQDEDMEQRLNQ